MQALDELTSRCIAAAAAEIESGAELDHDEAWVSHVMLGVFEQEPDMLAAAMGAVGDSIARGDDDPDLRAFRGLVSAVGYEYSTQGVAELLADVIYGRRGGVQDALHDLGAARDWAKSRSSTEGL